MRARGLLAGALAFLLLGAGSATAETGGGGKREVTVSVDLGKQDGMQVQLGATGAPADRAQLTVERRTRSGLALAAYMATRELEVGTRRLTVDFGPFGSVRLRFDEHRRQKLRIPKACSGNAGQVYGTRRFGIFRGSFALSGEGAYFEVEGTRVRGAVTYAKRTLTCSINKPRKTRRALLVSCPERTTDPALVAVRRRRDTLFDAGQFLRRAHVDVLRQAFTLGGPRSFVSGSRETATLTPGGPFSGTGSYADGELTGDLTVDFLGAPDTPLAPAPAFLADPGNPPARGCS